MEGLICVWSFLSLQNLVRWKRCIFACASKYWIPLFSCDWLVCWQYRCILPSSVPCRALFLDTSLTWCGKREDCSHFFLLWQVYFVLTLHHHWEWYVFCFLWFSSKLLKYYWSRFLYLKSSDHAEDEGLTLDVCSL